MKSKWGFAGRDWFFERLDRWLLPQDFGPGERIWLVTAEPGWGKSALASAICQKYPGALLWRAPYIDGTIRPSPWSREELDAARFVVIDGPRWLDWRVDLRDWVALSGIGCPVLVFARPHRGSVRTVAQGLDFTHLTSGMPENLADLRSVLGADEDAHSAHRSSRGNFLIAKLIAADQGQVDGVLDGLWDLLSGVVQEAPAELHSNLYRCLCLLAEAGEPLGAEQMADFLGCTSAQLEVWLGWLTALLHHSLVNSSDSELSHRPLDAWEEASGSHSGIDRDRCRYWLFNPWFARTISVKLRRDLESSHASVIAFFRETYPSWDEMTDEYGWNHLGHHCDLYGRSRRKRDFSVLYWLTEGAYLKNKLQKTRNLPSVLSDVRRALRAALEERDVTRVVHFGFSYPRLKRETAAPLMHELADKGQLDQALQQVDFLTLESSRFLGYAILAWQAAEIGLDRWAVAALHKACTVPLPSLHGDDTSLLVSCCVELLELLPGNQELILGLLSRDENPLRTSHNLLMLALVERLPGEVRDKIFEGPTWSIICKGPDHERLVDYVERSLRVLGKGHASSPKVKTLTEAQFEKRIATLNQISDDKSVDGLFQLLNDVILLKHLPAWFTHRAPLLIQVLNARKSEAEAFRGVCLLGRQIPHLKNEDLHPLLLDQLAQLVGEFQTIPLKARAYGELSIHFHRCGHQVRANSLLSKAASMAFQLSRIERSLVLKFLAGSAAQAGNSMRARDLAFHGIESLELGLGPVVELSSRSALRQAMVANVSDECSLQALTTYAEGCRHQDSVDLRIRSMSLSYLAESALGLGQEDVARQWLEQAIGMARALGEASERSHTLAKLAVTTHRIGDKARYESLMQEAMEASLQSAAAFAPNSNEYVEAVCEGLAVLAESRHSVKDPKAQAVESTLREKLESLSDEDLLASRALNRCVAAQRKRIFLQDFSPLTQRALDCEPPGIAVGDNDPMAYFLRQTRHDNHLSHRISLMLASGRWPEALVLSEQIMGTSRLCTTLAELAEAIICEDPAQALAQVDKIPMRQQRISAVLRCASRLSADLRPINLKANLKTTQELTLRAVEDAAAADTLLSRWIQLETDPWTLEKVARKMGWPLDEFLPEPLAAPAASQAAPASAATSSNPVGGKGDGMQPLTLRSVQATH